MHQLAPGSAWEQPGRLAAACGPARCQPGAAHLPPRPPVPVLSVLLPAGTLQRDFKHLAVDMFLTEEEGQKVLRVDCHFGRRKALASIRTCTSHVQVRTRVCMYLHAAALLLAGLPASAGGDGDGASSMGAHARRQQRQQACSTDWMASWSGPG